MTRIVWMITLLVLACRPSQSGNPQSLTSAGNATIPGSGAIEEGPALPRGVQEAARRITADRLREIVAGVSDDRFEGRGPGSKGDAAARAWLAAWLENIGYQPGASDGGWEQAFPIVGVTAKMPSKWSLGGGGKSITLRWNEDFIAASGVQQEKVEIRDAEIVFVGYGITAPEEAWDDFEGVDVRGKVLLVLNDDPDWDERFGGERRTYYGRWTYKYESAAAQGAAGAIIIHTDASAGYPWAVVQTSWSGEQFSLPAGDEPRTRLHAWVTEDAARRLAALGGHDLQALIERARNEAFTPVPLGVRTSLSFTTKLRKTETANVIGRLPGSDPALEDEAVVLTAHHDHLGVGAPDDTGDTIYNGARDNGAGIAQALVVAEALAGMPEPPRRSIVVALVGGEEQGLLGSAWYARHPTVPVDRIVANLNFELGNIWGPTKDVVIHGKGKSTLDDLVEAAAARQDRVARDEADPKAGWYYRSDQLSFARAGVPSMWFESGRAFVGRPPTWGPEQVDGWIRANYHRPSDELTDAWNFEGMVLDARLAFEVAAILATAEDRPTWNEDSEFARSRP